MKSNIQLAEDLRISERHFYRLLKDGRPAARNLWHENYVLNNFIRLVLLVNDLNLLASGLEKGAPTQFKQIRNFTDSLTKWILVDDGEWIERKLRAIAEGRTHSSSERTASHRAEELLKLYYSTTDADLRQIVASDLFKEFGITVEP